MAEYGVYSSHHKTPTKMDSKNYWKQVYKVFLQSTRL